MESIILCISTKCYMMKMWSWTQILIVSGNFFQLKIGGEIQWIQFMLWFFCFKSYQETTARKFLNIQCHYSLNIRLSSWVRHFQVLLSWFLQVADITTPQNRDGIEVWGKVYSSITCLLPTHTHRLGIKFVEYFPESIFYFFVPKAVDQGVQHGDHHRVKHRSNFVSVHGLAGAGL